MELTFEKFVPLKGSEGISVMLTASPDDIMELAKMQQARKTRKVELHFADVGAKVIPESRVILSNAVMTLEEALGDLRAALDAEKQKELPITTEGEEEHE